MSGPLANLQVVEMAGLGPCPLAGQLLADLGADVISIERQSAETDPTDINRRNKRSIALNLKTADGLAVAKKLIVRADILIEGFRPGVMEKLGLDPEACHLDNPELIFGRMTGWGQTGPLARTAGHDLNYLAITGALSAIGHKDRPPVPPLNLVADYGGGTMFLLFGILSALYERSHSGKGQVVDAAMVDGVPAMMGLLHSFSARRQWVPQRESNLLDGGAPFYRCYETADGRYLSVGPLEPQFFAQLLEKTGQSPTQKETQYDPKTWPDQTEHYKALFLSKTREEWMQIFNDSDACVAPVLNYSEVESHPHNAERATFVRVNDVLQAAPAPRFDRTPASPPAPPKAAGGDGNEILESLGYSQAEIERFKQSRVLT